MGFHPLPKTRLPHKLAASAILLAALMPRPALATTDALLPPPGVCIGPNIPVSSFSLSLTPASGGSPLPVDSVNRIQPGDTLKYQPIHLPYYIQNKARIAVMLVPASKAGHKDITILPAMPARATAQWKIPINASLVGVVFGPHGLDVKKVNSLVRKDPDLVPELARYAKQTATVNALIQTLSEYEQAPPGTEDLNAALQGFSSQYDVALPLVYSKGEPSSMQAALLLQGVLPSLSTADPTAYTSASSLAMEQSAGLAAGVAALFYGTPAVLAVGGASLFQSLRIMMFPDTDLRAAFTQPQATGGMQLCSSNQPPKPRARIAYLWVTQVPNIPPPSVSFEDAKDIAQGTKAAVRVRCSSNSQLRLLPRARDWKLVAAKQSVSVPAIVTVNSAWDTVSLDLTKVKVPAGSYHLAAMWDWTPFEVTGTLNLRTFSNFAGVKLTPESEDRLVQGSGPVKVEMTGADFEFVNQVTIEKSGDADASAQTLSYTIPKGKGADPLALDAEINTSKLTPGAYLLLLRQSDGKSQTVPVTIHPPDPKIDDLPLRANVGEKKQVLVLHGLDLERIVGIQSHEASWALSPIPAGSAGVEDRLVTISLHSGARVGDLVSASMQVEGLLKPVEVPGIVEVAGPLPEILSVKGSFPSQDGIALQPGEIPAGPASFVLQVQGAGSRPTVGVGCSDSGADDEALKLQPGARTGAAQLDYAGQGLLFLSLDPGSVGQSGCLLSVTVSDPDTGSSAPYNVGRVIQLPRIERFTLTDRSLGRNLYVGILRGQNLQVIQQTGWNARAGYPVQGIPTPVPGIPQEQTLEIELPWPPPSPHAPVYVWLLGETQGRRTSAAY
jgi:hypothetical protein